LFGDGIPQHISSFFVLVFVLCLKKGDVFDEVKERKRERRKKGRERQVCFTRELRSCYKMRNSQEFKRFYTIFYSIAFRVTFEGREIQRRCS